MNSLAMNRDKSAGSGWSHLISLIISAGKDAVGGAGAGVALVGLLNIVAGFLMVGHEFGGHHLDIYAAILGSVLGLIAGIMIERR
jgi:uncharacterized membrane protein